MRRIRRDADDRPPDALLPLSDLKVKLFGGPGASLATPATCGSYSTGVGLSSWSRKSVSLSSALKLDCRAGLGWFGPSFSSGTVAPVAVTPLLDHPLTGNVYFVEGTRKTKEGRTAKTLPKLWVALRGQVALDIWADSAIGKNKALETTFGFVPDAPITSFKLDINGGQHGILAVTGDRDANLCKRSRSSSMVCRTAMLRRLSLACARWLMWDWRWRATLRGTSGRCAQRPVKEFLMSLSDGERAAIVDAMRAVRDHGARVGGARKLRGRIWEVRVAQRDVIHRITFASVGRRGRVLLSLDAFVKKTQKTPPAKIDLAERRLKDWESRSAAT